MPLRLWEENYVSNRPLSSQASFPGNPVSGELLIPGDRAAGSRQVINQQVLKHLATWLDNVFVVPGTRWRFGLDPIIGLIPIVGDLATTLISLYIIASAAQMQVPKSTLARMGLNIVIDSVVGAIPLVGNVFDFAWKANALNMQLLERHANASHLERKKHSWWDWLLVGGMIAAVFAVVVGSLTSTFWLIGWLFNLVRAS
jgi:hypothetical protein